jgi:hypothetical protein
MEEMFPAEPYVIALHVKGRRHSASMVTARGEGKPDLIWGRVVRKPKCSVGPLVLQKKLHSFKRHIVSADQIESAGQPGAGGHEFQLMQPGRRTLRQGNMEEEFPGLA